MIQVRRATGADIPRLLILSRAEHARSRFSAEPMDESWVTQQWAHAINSPAVAVFVSPGGFIAGMVQPSLLNKRLTAYEVAWYAEDGSGLELLGALTQWARDMRATACVAHNYAGVVDSARMARAVARKGYRPLGESYTHLLEAC